MNKFLLLFFTFSLFACSEEPAPIEVPEFEPDIVENRWSDSTLRHIRTLEYNRLTTDLIAFLDHENAAYRSEAATAFGSVRDTLAIPELVKLLSDKHPKVQMSAAYALGQIGHSDAFEPLKAAFESNPTPDVQAFVLEAIGKCGHADVVNYLTGFDSLPDPIVSSGRAWGLYRALLNGQFDEKGTILIAESLMAISSSERFIAAHYLGRLRGVSLDKQAAHIMAALETDQEPEVQMMLVRALGKVNPKKIPGSKTMMLSILEGQGDHRVIVNAIVGAYDWKDQTISEAIENLLENPNVQVAVKASEYLIAHGEQTPERLIFLAQEAGHWRVKSNLYRAALKRKSKPEWVKEVKRKYANASSEYEKGALLLALSEQPEEMKFIASETLKSNPNVVLSSGMMALANLRMSDEFAKAQAAWDKNQTGMNYVHGFGFIIKDCIKSEDVAVVAQAASLLREENLGFKEQLKGETEFMEARLSTLTLPAELETYLELQKAIAYFKGTEVEAYELTYKPLDWDFIATIPSDQKVTLRTRKGDIKVQLFIDEAPASTASFVELAKSGFFDNKVFHRMVPNFVAQAGCPRGDGWGSPDFTIRSECGPFHYEEGTLGMASAGPDTESSQWFITHSPTPHLEGNYSIFGKVVEGMDVVQVLSVSDEITSVMVH